MSSRYIYRNPYDGLYIDNQYQGRPAIEDNTPIIGGVSYGEHPGEAIVVNPRGAPEIYRQWFNESVARASLRGILSRGRVLNAVYDTVEEKMPYSNDVVNEIVQDKRGKKIDLSCFMDAGGGVCRHQALTAGTLLEMHRIMDNIRGTPRVNRSERYDRLSGKHGGHAWARYTSYGGEVTILDVAQDYIGSLSTSIALAEHARSRSWDYRNEIDLGRPLPKYYKFGSNLPQTVV